ncbi:hypothetical protein Sango_3097400 [Sesamum angolense]|uniref:Retrotransposon gag domain-containing protein n=1 Tax=Sesamum angolense TaxID=2727404 RepID=A0AAE1W0D3_9LAMI|nr:hypothetical protein Sango_3097400 [Sesamum angolense]
MDTQGKAVKQSIPNSHIKVFKLKYQECWCYYEEHVKEAQRIFPKSPLAEYVEKNLHSPSYASESDAKNLPRLLLVPCLATPSQQMWLSYEFIEGTIRRKVEGSSRSSFTYSKPYTPRIDSLKMPIGTYGDHLVKQFVRSLKNNAFDWYTDLEAGSINGWEHLEQEFLNRFYNTWRTVSMVELTNSRQWKEEPVVDYINRWRNLSLNCKDRLFEASAIEMCIQGMHWNYATFFKQ